MPLNGNDPAIHATWRESFGWWNDEPYRQTQKILRPNGKMETLEKNMPALGENHPATQKPFVENNTEDWDLRERKIRDEKFSAASGKLKPAEYDRRAAERRGYEYIESRSRGKVIHSFAPLHTQSGYSFGRSVMLAEEIPAYAALAGYSAVALTDIYSMAGVLEFNKACKRHQIKPIFGATIEVDGTPGELVLIATNATGYTHLSQLLSDCHLHQPRLFPLATWELLTRYKEGLLCLTGGDFGPLDRLLAGNQISPAQLFLEKLIAIFTPKNLYLEIDRAFMPWSNHVEKRLLELAEKYQLTPVAGGAITHSRRGHFPSQDIIACAHWLADVDDPIGRKPFRDETQTPVTPYPRRALNAERFFRTAKEISALYSDRPDLLNASTEIAERCGDNILPTRPLLPQLFNCDTTALREIVEMNAHNAYPKFTSKHRYRLNLELDRIISLGYASHFLIAGDMCRWAGEQGIHLSGRGSAVDSAVAYVLGFSRIDAIQHKLHFDRFLPADGSKRPDIDIDFEARRRDDVRGYLIKKFGVERTASVAAFGSYRARGILRQVGKAMGLPEELISFLAKRVHGGVPADQLESALSSRPELKDNISDRAKFRWTFKLAHQLMDVPFGIGCHSSGLVVSAQPIREIVPVMWSGSPLSPEAGTNEPSLRLMQWDKRSAKHYFDKFDILCLRGQDVLSMAESKIRVHQPDYDAKSLPTDDPEIYRAMRSGELIGIPQSASPAMRQAHIRLKTNNLDDASLVQAGIRPGVGGAVKINELIARRRGKPYSYDHPDFEPILGNTYGIIVFQEQVDQLLQTFCGCSSGEAEDIRDAIHKRRREDYGAAIREELLDKCLKNGYSVSTAEQVCELVAGFKGYGFAQGHALAFAEISLRCVHLMQNQPAAYFSALLSAQPAGYYGSCTIANEARQRGIPILSPSVIKSEIDFTVEDNKDHLTGLTVPGGAIRTGLMQIADLRQSTRERIIEWNRILCPTPQQVREFSPLPSVKRKSRATIPKMAVMEATAPYNASLTVASPFASYFDFVLKVQPNRSDLEALIMSGALDSLCPNRRAMLWAIPLAQDFIQTHGLHSANPRLPLTIPEPPLDLSIPDFTIEERAVLERSFLGMDVKQHLMAFERERIQAKAILSTDIRNHAPGTKVIVVGNPIRLRFPPTSSGKRVVFFDLEDEFGLLNVTAFDDVYQKYGKAMITAPYVTCVGEVQDRDGHIAFLAHQVFEYKPVLLRGTQKQIPITGADFLMS